MTTHKFKKGESGNPAGRPAGKTPGAQLRKAIELRADDILQAVIDAVISVLSSGDTLKTALVNAVQESGHSKKRVNEVLSDYVGIKWVLIAGGKNAHLYSLIK